MIKKSIPVFFSLIFFSCSVSAQYKTDTLRFDRVSAEKAFLENNIPLLIEKLNISAGEARIAQAKVWPNPTFTLDELQLYRNATTDAIPPVVGNLWRDRNFAIQIEQLVLTAGKRRKNIQLETHNKEMAQNLFEDLLQALKAELRQTISEVEYLQNVQNSWQTQLAEVTRLLQAQEKQYEKGYISQADFFRLKALQISIRGEIAAFSEKMNEQQKKLKTLMYIHPANHIVINSPADENWISRLKSRTLSDLLVLSENNTRLRASQTQLRISEAQLEIEKANRIPNLNVIANYDRNGSTMRNFLGVGVSVDLPLFDRNKGNIRVAGLEVEKSVLERKNIAAELSNTIVQYWNDLGQSVRLFETIDPDYIKKLDEMTSAISENFSKQNISLLQFLDYYESFRGSKEQYYDTLKKITLQKEELNYLTGADL